MVRKMRLLEAVGTDLNSVAGFVTLYKERLLKKLLFLTRLTFNFLSLKPTIQ